MSKAVRYNKEQGTFIVERAGVYFLYCQVSSGSCSPAMTLVSFLQRPLKYRHGHSVRMAGNGTTNPGGGVNNALLYQLNKTGDETPNPHNVNALLYQLAGK